VYPNTINKRPIESTNEENEQELHGFCLNKGEKATDSDEYQSEEEGVLNFKKSNKLDIKNYRPEKKQKSENTISNSSSSSSRRR
jgi:hypothetical protein